MHKTFLAWTLLTGVASAAPGFVVRASQPISAHTPRASAQQLVESELWRQAYLRCAPSLSGSAARDPVQLASPSFTVGDGAVEAAASYQCGLGDAPDLARRLASAELVVTGKVIATRPAGIKEPVTEHAAHWAIATIEIGEVLKGSARKTVDVYFPASDDVAWVGRPKLVAGETGVFVIQNGTPGLQLPDSLDLHPADRRDAIWSLLNSH